LPEPPAIADRPGAAGAKAGSYSVIRVYLPRRRVAKPPLCNCLGAVSQSLGSWLIFLVRLSSIDLSDIPTFYQLPFTAERGVLSL